MIILGPVAVANNSVIGKNNDLPWYFPEDLMHFKKITFGQVLLMGRNTFESIMKRLGKPLQNRKNVVITRQLDYKAPKEVLIFHDVLLAIQSLSQAQQDIYVIGGEQIFRQLLPFCGLAYITHIHDNYEGDAFFPKINWHDWEKIAEEKYDGFSFVTYAR
ncbi:Dihydrofolate reductase [Gammaproteobacteria bacterium]